MSKSDSNGMLDFYQDESPIVTPNNYQFNTNLVGFWRTKRDIKVLKGGRASGKTWDTAAMSVYLASKYTLRFLCVRQFQNNINDSVYAVIKDSIERLGYGSEFGILKNSIVHKKTDSNFIFYGFQKHTASIKGMEAIDVLWIEEGESLTAEQWEIIEPTIRKENSECWLIYNPRLVSDFPERHFKHSDENGILVRHINYDENPFLSDKMMRTIDRAKEQNFEVFQHVYLGVPRSDDDSAIIKRSWIESAIDAHKKLDIDMTGARTVGFDVADDGEDKCATVFMDGSICQGLEEWAAKSDELMKSTERALSFAKKNRAKNIGYDSVGVGAGVGSMLSSKGFHGKYKFNAGGKVYKPDHKDRVTGIPNKEYYSNLKSQAWWLLANRFMNTFNAVTKGYEFKSDEMISIDSSSVERHQLDKLVDELSTPKRDFDNQARVKVESKKDLAKRDIKSPNLADAFIIANSRGLVRGGSNLRALAESDEKNKTANETYIDRMNRALSKRF